MAVSVMLGLLFVLGMVLLKSLLLGRISFGIFWIEVIDEDVSEYGRLYKPNLCINVSSFLCLLFWSLVKSTLKSSFFEFWYNGATF